MTCLTLYIVHFYRLLHLQWALFKSRDLTTHLLIFNWLSFAYGHVIRRFPHVTSWAVYVTSWAVHVTWAVHVISWAVHVISWALHMISWALHVTWAVRFTKKYRDQADGKLTLENPWILNRHLHGYSQSWNIKTFVTLSTAG